MGEDKIRSLTRSKIGYETIVKIFLSLILTTVVAKNIEVAKILKSNKLVEGQVFTCFYYSTRVPSLRGKGKNTTF